MSRVMVLALVLLSWPATAEAGWKIDRAQAIAGIVFPVPCQRVDVAWGDPHAAFPDSSFSAFSAPRAWTSKGRCEVTFDGVFEQRWGFGWREFCSMMIHEYGHLAGLEHSTNVRSVMRANYDDGQPDRRCAKRGRPYLEKWGVLPVR